MRETLTLWLADPLAIKAAFAALALVVIVFVVRLTIRGLAHRVPDAGLRYRVRKFVVLIGYLVALLITASLFSVRWSGTTLALGVAGAGIAFALQEVIASVAGWLSPLAAFTGPVTAYSWVVSVVMSSISACCAQR